MLTETGRTPGTSKSVPDMPMYSEWGKRYLKPMAEWFGFHFPDKITNVRPGVDHQHTIESLPLLRFERQ